MPSVWAPPRASTYWESWTCTQGSFLSGKSSLCRSITSSRELPNREGVTMARLLWSISSKVGLRRPWRGERWGKIYYLGMSGTMIRITAVSAAVPLWLGLCLCLCLWLGRSACNHVSLWSYPGWLIPDSQLLNWLILFLWCETDKNPPMVNFPFNSCGSPFCPRW